MESVREFSENVDQIGILKNAERCAGDFQAGDENGAVIFQFELNENVLIISMSYISQLTKITIPINAQSCHQIMPVSVWPSG